MNTTTDGSTGNRNDSPEGVIAREELANILLETAEPSHQGCLLNPYEVADAIIEAGWVAPNDIDGIMPKLAKAVAEYQREHPSAPASVSEGPSRGADAPLAHQEQTTAPPLDCEQCRMREMALDSLQSQLDGCRGQNFVYQQEAQAAQATAERLRRACDQIRAYAHVNLTAAQADAINRMIPLPEAASDSAKDKETGNG